MDWKNWFEGTSDKDIPDLDRKREEDELAQRKREEQEKRRQEKIVEAERELREMEERSGKTEREAHENVPACDPSEPKEKRVQQNKSERKEEPQLRADMMPKKAPAPRKGSSTAKRYSDPYEEEEYFEDEPEEDYREEDYEDEYDEEYSEDYEEDYEEDYGEDRRRNRAVEKEDPKKLKGKIKKIVRGFRLRSVGMIFLGIGGLAACAVMGIFLHRLIVGILAGGVCILLAFLFEIISWAGAARDVNEDTFTDELRLRYRKAVFQIGVYTLRLLCVLFAWGVALWYIDSVLDIAFTWTRWLIYGVLFSVLAWLFCFYLDPVI